MNAPTGPVLRDIHLPAEPSWWPPAPGWWLLAALGLAALSYLLWLGLRRRRLIRARTELRREFERACVTPGAAQVAALSELLRRVALRYAPASAALRDEAWLAFLDGDDAAQPFRRGPGRLLLDGPYRSHVDDAQAAALAQTVRRRLDRFVTLDQPLAASTHSDVQVSRAQSLPRTRSGHAQERPDLRDIRTSGPQPLSAPGLRDIRTSGPHV